jgi:hypothetical protein
MIRINLVKVTFALLAALLGWAFDLPVESEPLPSPGQVLKYFNPIHERSYLNESQDRIIKKKSYKNAGSANQQAIQNKEVGLFAIMQPGSIADSALTERLLNNRDINGLSCLIPWSLIEPNESQFDFHSIDQLLTCCQKHNKSLILRFSTCGTEIKTAGNKQFGSDTPDWVFNSGVTKVPYLTLDGDQHLMPVFWDTTYLAKWANFISEVGRRYDKHPAIHSIGITGGGILGGTAVVPDFSQSKDNYEKLEGELKSKFKMTPRQLVSHWQYVADLFPRAFPTTALNFDIDPPLPNRSGQDVLDEITDYLIYRYGERIFLTRQGIKDSKHGFDQYRIILKFKSDTLTGYQLSASISDEALTKAVKCALDDGISFAEVPASFFDASDQTRPALLHALAGHLGYQVVAQEVKFPPKLKSGNPLSVSFKFVNTGAATPKRPARQLDKDVPASYKIQVELRDQGGKTLVASRHTPDPPTTAWIAGKVIAWQKDLKMPLLKPGSYSVWISLINEDTHKKLSLLNAIGSEPPIPEDDCSAGKVEVVAN